MLRGLEIGRHAAVHLAVLLDAAAEGNALQVALQRVIPLVVGTGKAAVLAVAVALSAELHAAVGADVLDDIDAALGVAHHDDRALADDSALEVAGIRDFRFQADVAPVLAVEEAFEFLAVLVGFGISHEGDAAGAVRLPVYLLRKYGGCVVHDCLLDN